MSVHEKARLMIHKRQRNGQQKNQTKSSSALEIT